MDTNCPAARPRVSRRRAKAIYGFMLIMHFMLAIDITSVAVALPAIARDMNASKTAVFSMGTVFSLSATMFQLPISEVSHATGRKPAFLLVLFMFAMGSIIAAVAKDMATLLVGRGVQGFASGGSVLSALVLTDLIELRDRATWLSVQNGMQALGLIIGPLVGAAVIRESTWRWLFWINLPPIAVAAIGLALLLGFDHPAEGILGGLGKVDWMGILIFMPSAVAVLVPFTMSGIFFPWISWRAMLPLALGSGGLTLLGFHQRCMAKRPMFRPSLFEKWATIFGFLGQAVFGVCVNMIFYYLVVFWSGVWGFDELLTGVALLPETFCIPVAAIACGLTMRMTGKVRWAMWVGWPLTSLSIGLLWFLDNNTPLGALIVINMGVGLGAGIVSSALNMGLLVSTEKGDNGHAMAMGFLSKSAGMCLGIAIGTAVFTIKMDSELQRKGDAEVTAESFLRMLKQVRKDETERQVIVHTLRILWIICCGLSALVGLLCCCCRYPEICGPDGTVNAGPGGGPPVVESSVAGGKGQTHLAVVSTTRPSV